MPGPPRRSLIIDTDGGTDDAVALWWALSQPAVDVVAVVATAGVVSRGAAAANAARILHAAGRPQVPVALGAAAPLGPPALRPGTHRAHGTDGLGGHAYRWPTAGIDPVAEPAADLLARLAAERPGEIDVVTIGPLSTLAATIRAQPAVARQMRSLTVMGGSIEPGASVPVVEANVGRDPVAAAEVASVPWPGEAPPLLVPLDVTLRALLRPWDLDALAAGRTPAARFLSGPLGSYAREQQRAGRVPAGTAACHDLVTVLAALCPHLVTDAVTARLAVDLVPGSPRRGAMVLDGLAAGPAPARDAVTGTPWRVARRADGDRFRAAFRSLVGAVP